MCESLPHGTGTESFFWPQTVDSVTWREGGI